MGASTLHAMEYSAASGEAGRNADGGAARSKRIAPAHVQGHLKCITALQQRGLAQPTLYAMMPAARQSRAVGRTGA